MRREQKKRVRLIKPRLRDLDLILRATGCHYRCASRGSMFDMVSQKGTGVGVWSIQLRVGEASAAWEP